MLTSVLLDYSCPLTPNTSARAAMGGDLEVLDWLRGASPAGPHVRGGATARHAPPSRAWRRPPPPRTTGPLTSRLPGTPRLPASRENVHRRTTTIALALVLVVTRRTCILLLTRFSTPLSTTCGCASGKQRVPRRSKKRTERSSYCFDLHDRSRRRRHRYLFCRSWACRSGCRRFPAPAAIAAANLPAAEVHERFIQCDRPQAYDLHLPSAAGQTTSAQTPAEALTVDPDTSHLWSQDLGIRVQSLWLDDLRVYDFRGQGFGV
jgi:hypothetical protein